MNNIRSHVVTLSELELNFRQWILDGLIFLKYQCAYCIFLKKKMLNLKDDYLEPSQGAYWFIGAQPIFYPCMFIDIIITLTNIFQNLFPPLPLLAF